MANIYPQPLPPNSYNPSTEAPLHDAYQQCLMMEGAAGDDKILVHARCLGYLLRELPYEAGEIVADEIVACNADFDKMSTLSMVYINHLIRLFRRSKGSTPAPSEHPSRPSCDMHSNFYMHSNFFSEAVNPAPTDHKTAKTSALKRDNYRCVVTGWADSSSIDSMKPADLQRYNLHQNPMTTVTNYCHIFPPLTNWGFNLNDPAEKKKKYAGNVWAIINSFRNIDILSELDGEKIHHLTNGFTMSINLHALFDDLQLWFEHVAGNSYNLVTTHNIGILQFLPPNPIITFTSVDPSLCLPNPEYLKLHAAICRVAHMSGAGRYLDLEDREVERLGVLACDGSSADLLSSRLRHLAISPA